MVVGGVVGVGEWWWKGKGGRWGEEAEKGRGVTVIVRPAPPRGSPAAPASRG